MNKFLKFSVCMFILAGVLSACGSEEEPQIPYLSVSADARTHLFAAEGGNVEVLVNTNADFTVAVASSAETWLTASKGNKSGDDVALTITAGANTSDQGRAGKITLSASGLKSIEIDVTQAGVHHPLALSSFEPLTGGHSSVVTLTGENFGDMVGAVKVYFNDTRAEISEISNTSIIAFVPKGPGDICDISVVVGNDSLAYSQKFTYQKMPYVYDIVSGGDFVPASGIAVDENDNIVYAKRYGNNDRGIYRINQKDNNSLTLLSDISNLAGSPNLGDPLGIVYDQVSGKFYVNVFQTENFILTIDTKDQWKVEKHIVTINGDETPRAGSKWGIAFQKSSGNLYTRYNSGDVVKINPTTWQGDVITTLTAHGTNNQSWALAFRESNPDQLWFVICASSEMGYIDVSKSTDHITWLNTSIERGHFDGTFDVAIFNEARFMCSDAAGNLYLADQSNRAIRKITNNAVETFAGGMHLWDIPALDLPAPAIETRFDTLEGICVASDGTIYVGDTWGNRIRKIVFE